MASQHSTHFIAASIPRFIRNMRLSHLRMECIIGCWAIENPHDINIVYDVIMLPAPEFMRAMTYLSMPVMVSPALRREKFDGGYSPRDIKEFVVPVDERDPRMAAIRHFVQAFNLHIHRTIYDDALTVVASVAQRAIEPTPTVRAVAPVKSLDRFPSRQRSAAGMLRASPQIDFRDCPAYVPVSKAG